MKISIPKSDNHFKKPALYQFTERVASILGSPEKKCALDIGAHIGTYSMHYSQHFEKVISFEPFYENYMCLGENMRVYGKAKDIQLNCGLGSKVGLIGLRKPVSENSGSVVSNKIIQESDEIAVITRLDDLLIPDCSLIKIDVEGYEKEIIEGGRSLIKRCSPTLFIEYDPDNRKSKVCVKEIREEYQYNGLFRFGKNLLVTKSTKEHNQRIWAYVKKLKYYDMGTLEFHKRKKDGGTYYSIKGIDESIEASFFANE